MHEALQAVVLKPIMNSIGGLQRSVNELKKEKAENKEEKRLKKNLDNLGDHLASVVHNVHDLQSKLQGAMPLPPANN
jgi:FtsZ-binding cell division protein ZapB